MRLEALKFVIGAEIGVFVVQRNDKAHRHLVVFQMVQKRTAIRARIQRPTEGVNDKSRLMLCRIYFPQLLDADCKGLRINAIAQLETLEKRFRQRSTASFGKQGVPAM